MEAVKQRFQNLEILRSQCGASGSAQHREEKNVEHDIIQVRVGAKTKRGEESTFRPLGGSLDLGGHFLSSILFQR